MYQCKNINCNLEWDRDYDKCPVCRGNTIPKTMTRKKGELEMNAAEAKELTKQSEAEMANRWWNEFSPKLFKAIEDQCRSRQFELMIDIKHKELNDMNWIAYYVLFDKAKEEVEKLGYTFKHDTDDFNEWVNIKW